MVNSGVGGYVFWLLDLDSDPIGFVRRGWLEDIVTCASRLKVAVAVGIRPGAKVKLQPMSMFWE